MSEEDAKRHIEDIQKDYISNSPKRAKEALSGSLWLVERSFERRRHFLLEFIQNAEDAEAKKMKVILRDGKLIICNDGRQFTREDVEAICSIGKSSKDPKEGYLGYLGAGFKSVFLISTSPHIISRPYKFKIDRNYWKEPENIPWQVTPIWLDHIPEEVASEAENWSTCFLIPINQQWVDTIKKELENLDSRFLLFLHNLKEVELYWDGNTKVIRKKDVRPLKTESSFEAYTLTLQVENNSKVSESSWITFRSVKSVPENVKNDVTTKEWKRDKVNQREIAVAFALDEEGDLKPLDRGVVRFGVFSYLPLSGEEHQIPFIVHSDFLVHPGREVMDKEAKWNMWLLKELYDFITKEIIPYFKIHHKWNLSYTSVLCGSALHIIEEHLMKPLRKELENGAHILDIHGEYVSKDRAIIVDEKVLEELGPEFIERITEKRIVHPKAKVCPRLDVKKVSSVLSLLKLLTGYGYYPNWQLFEREVKRVCGDDWIKCYRKILKALAGEWLSYNNEEKDRHRYEYVRYTLILDEQGSKVVESVKVYIATYDIEDLVKKHSLSFRLLHPDLRDEQIVEYLKDLRLISELTKDEVEREIARKKVPMLLDKLQDDSISSEEKVNALIDLESIYEMGINAEELQNYVIERKIKVLTKSGKWVNIKNVLFSSEYKPDEDIERLVNEGLLDVRHLESLSLEFLNPIFVSGVSSEKLVKWREFFQKLGLGGGFYHDHNDPRRKAIIERVAIMVALKHEIEEHRLSEKEVHVVEESERGRGYDIESKMRDGSPMYIEVKGSGEYAPQISLTASQYRLIISNPEKTFIYIVTNALRDPELHVVPAKLLIDKHLTEKIELKLEHKEWTQAVKKRWKPLS